MNVTNIFLKTLNDDGEIGLYDLPLDDPKQRRPDISLAKKELNWGPTTDLEEGLKRTISYFDGILSQKELISS